MLHLWDFLKSDGFKFLFTQDCLENHFASIRHQSENCRNPTPIQFSRAFQKLLCLNLSHSGTENCEIERDNLLLKITDVNYFQKDNQIIA